MAIKTKLLLFCSITAPICGSYAAKKSEVNRPNIIYIMTDDQGLKTISGLFGDDKLKTPNLDRMIESGVTFMNHYATTSISMASRAIVMTGLYEYKTGCNFLHGALSPQTFEKSYPVILRENGYFTGFAGKFGFAVTQEEGKESCASYDSMPIDEFDVWAGGTNQTSYTTADNEYMSKYAEEYPHSTRSYGAFACDFIDQAQEVGKPFCLSISFKAPHAPRTPDPIFMDVYADTEFAPPASAALADDILPLQAKLGRQYLTYFGGVLHKDFEESLRLYHTQIYGVDYAVGMIIDKLRDSGLDENTVIIFTSDNGYALGEHRMGGKALGYDSNSRIPLIVVDPYQRGTSGQRSQALTGNIDMAPTILDYAGIEIPKSMDGKSLKSVIESPESNVRDNLSLINVWGSPACFSLSIVSEKMKYIYWGFADKMDPVEELFDLNADPEELNNLSGKTEYQDQLRKMRILYDKRLADWQTNGTSRNYYLPFATILDRNIEWESRKALIRSNFWESYESTITKQLEYDGDPYDYPEIIKRRL